MGQFLYAGSFLLIRSWRIERNPNISYQDLLRGVRDILRSKYSQKPQLSSSHPINTEIMFVC